MKQFIQDTWYWWESNDKSIATWAWQVYTATWVNITEDSKSFMTSNWNLLRTSTVKSTNDKTMAVVWGQSLTYRMFFMKSWESIKPYYPCILLIILDKLIGPQKTPFFI